MPATLTPSPRNRSYQMFQKQREHTPVDDVMLMAPVDCFDQLVDVATCFLSRHTIGQLLQQFKHVLKDMTHKTKLMTTITVGDCSINVILWHAHLLHILKDKVQLSSSAEGLFQLNNILLFEGAEHLKLP